MKFLLNGRKKDSKNFLSLMVWKENFQGSCELLSV